MQKKYGPEFPRKSELRAFDEVDARAAAVANLSVGFHRETGFIGHKIKAENSAKDIELNCSEYDRLLLIFKDGLYKVVPVPEKLFVGQDLYYRGVITSYSIHYTKLYEAVGAGGALTGGAATGDYDKITETAIAFINNIKQARNK